MPSKRRRMGAHLKKFNRALKMKRMGNAAQHLQSGIKTRSTHEGTDDETADKVYPQRHRTTRAEREVAEAARNSKPERRAARIATTKIAETNKITANSRTYANVTRPSQAKGRSNSVNPHLMMSCDEDELSEAQLEAHYKAVRAYQQSVEQLEELKKQPGVHVIHLEHNEEAPAPPTEMTFLPLPAGSLNGCCAAPSSPPATAQLITLAQSAREPAAVNQIPQFKLLLDPRTGLLYSTVPAVTSAPLMTQTVGIGSPQTVAGTVVAGAAHNQPSPSLDAPEPAAPQEPSPSVAASKAKCDNEKEKSPKVYCVQTDLLVRMSPQRKARHYLLMAKQDELDLAIQSLVNSEQMELEKWLLEKGLFGTARHCAFHVNVAMKLMRVTTSEGAACGSAGGGGYKWWCPSCARMIPVVQGSFFARWTADLVSTLKTMYHWASCSEIVRVFRDVDMNVAFVHSVYSALRTVCSSQMGTLVLGGPRMSVEIAEENLGPCAESLQQVYAFCVYDRNTRHVILGAGLSGNPKNNVGVVAKAHIHRETTIIGDKLLLQHLPQCFRERFVAITRNESGIGMNINARSYLQEQVVPRLKDKCKSMRLKTIQILLDELAWRERFGEHSLAAFVNILTHIKHAYSKTVVKPLGVHSMPITSASGIKLIHQLPSDDSITDLPVGLQSDQSLISGSSTRKSLVGPPAAVGETEDKDGALPSTSSGDEIIEVGRYVNYASKAKPGWKVKGTEEKEEEEEESPTRKKMKVSSSSSSSSSEEDEEEMMKDPNRRVTSLDAYYYAWKEGDMNVIHNQSKGVFKFKCHACKKVLDNNVKMMKHLRGHIESRRQKNLDLSDLTQCKHCFRDFETPYAMQCHVEDVHLRSSNSLTCRICERAYTEKRALRRHMRRHHVEAEMPYVCEVCHFRSSVYRSIITHFQVVHGGTDHVQCHYCLRTFQTKFSSLQQIGMTSAFYLHLYKHQTKSLNRKCNGCCLTFPGNKELKSHRDADHVSYYGREGVHRFTAFDPNNVIMVLDVHRTKADGRGLSPARRSNQKGRWAEKSSTPSKPRHFSANVILQMIGTKSPARSASTSDDEVYTCVECNQPIDWENHFKKGNSIACSICSYSTNCGRSFADHLIYIHSDRPRGSKVHCRKMKRPMHCLCGFVGYRGDSVAKHLVMCGQPTCYGDLDDAGPSSPGDRDAYPRTEEDEDCANLDEQRSMLNVLGLMRVPATRDPRNTNRGDGDGSSTASADEDMSMPVSCEMPDESLSTAEDDGFASRLCPEVSIVVKDEDYNV